MKTIVVGLDASPRAEGVLRVAANLATSFGGRLTLVRAVDVTPELPPEALKLGSEGTARVLETEAQKDLAAAAVQYGPLIDRTQVRVGAAWQVLSDVAKETRAELLVVGTHGFSGIDHVIGTTASRLVNHAPCSVLVVRGV
jgi:nucleotide-binding universal stress UspA family protein